MEPLVTLPLPEDPALAAWASALNNDGYWAEILDAGWRLVFVTDELRLSFGDAGASTSVPIGQHWFSTLMIEFTETMLGGTRTSPGYLKQSFRRLGPYVLSGTPGGRDSLKRDVDPELSDLVEEIEPHELPLAWSSPARPSILFGGAEVTEVRAYFRIDDGHGNVAGIAILVKPAAGMSQLASATATADLGHLERMRLVERPDRRPTAILIADLEASSPLSRRLSTAQYFAFGRRLVRAADKCVIDEGGIVGRHAGDGVTAFFLAETCGSESEAARACIAASRALRRAVVDVTARSEMSDTAVSLRFGLHWGSTLYVGRILTAGRSEVTALGDEVNEAARIEASATGGRTLASKSLVERLSDSDAKALGIDAGRARYTSLGELPTATEKARRDAPSIAVCEV